MKLFRDHLIPEWVRRGKCTSSNIASSLFMHQSKCMCGVDNDHSGIEHRQSKYLYLSIYLSLLLWLQKYISDTVTRVLRSYLARVLAIERPISINLIEMLKRESILDAVRLPSKRWLLIVPGSPYTCRGGTHFTGKWTPRRRPLWMTYY